MIEIIEEPVKTLTVIEEPQMPVSVPDQIIIRPDIYEGEYSVMPSTSDQTLETAEKLLAQNVIVAGDPDLIASNIRYDANIFGVQGSDRWDFKGDRWELVSTPYVLTSATLKSTSFNSWTPSTTAKTIKSSVNAATFTSDFANYEYLLKWTFQFDAVYQSGVTPVSAPDRTVAELYQSLFKRPNSLANIEAENFVGNTCVTYFTAALMRYFNANSGSSYTWSASYGVYPTATAATFANSTSNSTTVTVKTPAITARCSTTYMTTTAAGQLDQEKSIFKLKGELYRAKIGGAMRDMYAGVTHLFNNPI